MNDLAGFIKQAEADVQEQEALLASAEERLAEAQADVTAASAKLAEVRIVLDWLCRRNGSQPMEAPTAEQPDRSQSEEPQMRFGRPVPDGPSKLQQCLDALGDLGSGASNKQISQRLLRDGVVMDPNHVRGLLKYASTKPNPPVTTKPGSGVWRLVRSPNGAGGGL